MNLMLSTILNGVYLFSILRYSVSFSLSLDIIPAEGRALWQIPIQVSNLLGQVLGGVVEGHMVDKFGWHQYVPQRRSRFHECLRYRRAFWLELSIAVMSYILVIARLKHPNDATDAEPCSFLGAFPLAGGLACLVLALNVAGVDITWSDIRTCLLFVLLAVCLILFLLFETRAKKPLIPWKNLRRREIASMMGIAIFTALTDMSVSKAQSHPHHGLNHLHVRRSYT
jgi:MFS family permease